MRSARRLVVFLWLVNSWSIEAAEAFQPALDSISAAELLSDVEALASDEMEGRGPGTRGEERATKWIVDQFRAAGLQPGAADGGWFQEVPMVGIRSGIAATLRRGTSTETLVSPQDFVAWAPPQQPLVAVEDSQLVFVGYGVVAPEYGWDDFKDVDVRGKTILMLVNDPPVPDPKDTAKLDPAVFKGNAMTYYGRWTYKFEIAAKKGAAAALVIHETGPAGYPWFVVVNSWSRENFALVQAGEPTAKVAGWLSLDTTKRLFTEAGQDFDALKRSAVRRDFRPVSLPVTATFSITNTLRRLSSKNVVGELPGSDPKQRDDWIIYTAHWDHLGRDERLDGDQIFNGALDNATGTAGLIALAQAFAKLPTRPARSLLFIALTAEEQGLLGARYYAANPLHPLARTVANLNMDGLNPWGRTLDFAIVGLGNSSLDELARRFAQEQGRSIIGETQPEKGTFYRSDHFEFSKVGVPALYGKGGTNYVGRPVGWGRAKADEFTERDYHKVSDVVKPDWDLAGAVEDLRLLFRVGYELATTPLWPEWYPGTEFRARREESLKLSR